MSQEVRRLIVERLPGWWKPYWIKLSLIRTESHNERKPIGIYKCWMLSINLIFPSDRAGTWYKQVKEDNSLSIVPLIRRFWFQVLRMGWKDFHSGTPFTFPLSPVSLFRLHFLLIRITSYSQTSADNWIKIQLRNELDSIVWASINELVVCGVNFRVDLCLAFAKVKSSQDGS